MEHAKVPVGEYLIPLIGIAPSSVEEKCEHCKTIRSLWEIELVWKSFLCRECKESFGHIYTL